MRRGCLWTIGIVVGIIVVGWLYLVLNPPFGLPETGYLSQTRSQDVSLTAEQPAAAFRIRVTPSAGIYAGASATFEPLRVEATLLAGGSVDPALGLHVYPLDGGPIGSMEVADGRHVAAWRMDCHGSQQDQPCPRDFLAVLSGPPAQPEEVQLQLFAEQTFPPNLPTPFMVSIEIDVTRVELPDATALLKANTTATIQLSPDSPVAMLPLAVAGGDTNLGGGALLVADVERIGDSLPAGLRAPAPVQVAVLDAAESILGQMGVRPGARGAIALPPLAGEHRLVAWWQDRADQEYELTLSVEQTRLGGGDPPTLAIGTLSSPAPVWEQVVQGSQVATPGSNGPSLELLLETDVGAPDQGQLAAVIGVAELRFRVERDDEHEGTVLFQLAPSGGYDPERVPLPVALGEEVETALALPACTSSRCEGWNLIVEAPDNQPVRITWHGVLRLWRLDQAAGGAL